MVHKKPVHLLKFPSYSITQPIILISYLESMHAQSYTRHQYNVELCPHIKQMVFNLISKLRFAIRVIQRIPQKVAAKEPSEHNCSNYIKFKQFMKYVCETVLLNRRSRDSKSTHSETRASTNVEWCFLIWANLFSIRKSGTVKAGQDILSALFNPWIRNRLNYLHITRFSFCSENINIKMLQCTTGIIKHLKCK